MTTIELPDMEFLAGAGVVIPPKPAVHSLKPGRAAEEQRRVNRVRSEKFRALGLSWCGKPLVGKRKHTGIAPGLNKDHAAYMREWRKLKHEKE